MQTKSKTIVFSAAVVLISVLPSSLFGQQNSNEQFWFPTSTMRIASSRTQTQYSMKKCVQESLCFYHADASCQLHSMNRNSFYQSFQPGVPICIFVHGSYMNWDDVPADSASVEQWVRAAFPGQSTQLIYYTWCSEMSLTTALPQVDTNKLGRKSAFNGLYLSQLISQLPQNCPITLIGHSFGCRTISSGLHLLGGGKVQGFQLQGACNSQHRVRALFTAAPIDHNWLNPDGRYGRVLQRAEHIVNLKTRDDWALGLYPLRRPFSRRSLGRRGWSNKDYVAMGRLRCKVSEYDVTCHIGMGHGWPFYAKRQDLARFLGTYIYFVEGQQVTRNQSKQQIEQRISQTPLIRPSTPVPFRTPARETYATFRSRH